MARYTLIDPVTGEQHTLSELELTRNIQIGCILLQGQEHVGIITRRDLVAFARWCAGKILARLKCEPDHTVTHALSLVDRWLEDERSVTSEELEAAQDAAWDAGSAAWVAADAAARATADAWAAAAGAARAAASAACAAADATAAAWTAAAGAISYEVQAQWWVEHLQTGK